MQLKMQTDYAIRILLYLSGNDGRAVSLSEIAENMGISRNYLPKITKKLRDAEWIRSEVGITGGFTLVRQPEEISLWDIMMQMEDSVRVNRCLEDDGYCSRDATGICPVHNIYCGFQQLAQWYFQSISIRDLGQGDVVEGFYANRIQELDTFLQKKKYGFKRSGEIMLQD